MCVRVREAHSTRYEPKEVLIREKGSHPAATVLRTKNARFHSYEEYVEKGTKAVCNLASDEPRCERQVNISIEINAIGCCGWKVAYQIQVSKSEPAWPVSRSIEIEMSTDPGNLL
ncbi:unnamed protein product [Leptosia nina]|uniref:Uncharacterized protein n=1 Tax=Leptosia nina TaxID=320188 RepID=A0AAV1K1G1_9NEOP